MGDEKITEYKWGSNIPAIKTIMDFFNPTGVLELGIGRYSTPLLYKYDKNLISIETDGVWIEAVKEMIEPRDNFRIIHHGSDIQHKTKFNQISEEIKQECVEFYKQHITPISEFLFVDHVSGLRASSLLGLFDKFKYIAYHDAEQFEGYNYKILTKEKSKDYIHLMNKMPLVYTGILIHKDNKDSINAFIDLLDRNNRNYCELYAVDYKKDIVFI